MCRGTSVKENLDAEAWRRSLLDFRFLMLKWIQEVLSVISLSIWGTFVEILVLYVFFLKGPHGFIFKGIKGAALSL